MTPPLPALSIVALTFAAPAHAQFARFEGENARHWVAALTTDEAGTIEQLAAGGEEVLPMLRTMLDFPQPEVRRAVTRVCGRLGPIAAPIVDHLLQRDDPTGSTISEELAEALAAIGDRRPEVTRQLLARVLASRPDGQPTAHGRALQTLDEHAVEQVLRAVDAETEAPTGIAQALDAFDDRALPTLIAALGAAAPRAAAAQGSLLRRGWRAATLLERAGHVELARQALRCDRLALEVSGWQFELAPPADAAPTAAALPPMPVSPTLSWEQSREHGDTLVLLRAANSRLGFIVERLELQIDANTKTTRVTSSTTELPRSVAFAAVRQVAALPTLQLQQRSAGTLGSRWQHHFALRLVDQQQVLLDDTFTDLRGTVNAVRRFPVEAGCVLLDDLLRDADWQPRELADADREQLRNTLARADAPAWLHARLHALADALGVEHD